MDNYCVKLDPETELYCTLVLYADVKNCSEVRDKIVLGVVPCCVTKASLIVDPLQAIVAVNKAALNAKRNRLITRNMYSEVLYYLSKSKNITRALCEFGVNQCDTNILVILIHKLGKEQDLLTLIYKLVYGQRLPVSRIKDFTNVQLVKKIYQIKGQELSVTSLLNAVVSRISCKDVLLAK